MAVSEVRSVMPETAWLMVECDYTLDPHTALTVASQLGPIDCYWLESPLRWDDPAELAHLRAKTSVRIASGETGHGRGAFRELLERHSVDVLQPDVKWSGGILEAKKIASWAEAYQVAVALHNNSGPVATAASAHLSLTLPNAVVLEVPSKRPNWEADLVEGTEVVLGGTVEARRLEGRPGLGVAFDERVARRVAGMSGGLVL